MANPPIVFRIYQMLTSFIGPFIPKIIGKRVKQQKESPLSLSQRLGDIEEKQIQRPIWIHAASVGESMIGMNIAREIQKAIPSATFFFTAQTIAAHAVFKKSNIENSHFQFAPIDTPKIAHNFVQNLSPCIAIFIEGEIWPNILVELDKAKIPKLLVNARLTQKSINNWKRFGGLGVFLFSAFDFIHAANEKSANALGEFSNKNIEVGNLKFAAPPPNTNDELINEFKKFLVNRKIWLCASSHIGEEEIILNTHQKIKQNHEEALLIIAPRHLERVNSIIKMCEEHGLVYFQKSGGHSIPKHCDIIIWDTLGELGSAYKIADCCFIAGSLLTEIGGHNPIEPAKLDCPIITGPYFHNFEDIFQEFESRKGALIAKSSQENELTLLIERVLFDADLQTSLSNNAKQYVDENANHLSKVLAKIITILKGNKT